MSQRYKQQVLSNQIFVTFMMGAVLLIMFVCSVHPLLGQATASLRVAVTDSSGAAVAGASVKATQNETGRVTIQTTNSSGYAVLTPIPTGTYDVAVSGGGFEEVVTKGLLLDVGQDRLLPIVLKVASVQQTVQVSKAA